MTAAPSSAQLILHPIRLRIIQAMLGGRQRTTSQLAEELADVAPATLYRHVGTLAKAGVLEVVGERRARGAVERTYGLHLDAASVSPTELEQMSPTDHRRAFLGFVAGLLAQFDAYLTGGDVDLVRDGAGYRQVALWLSDAELASLMAEVRAAFARVAEQGPAQGRRRRDVVTLVIPGPADEDLD